MDYKDQLLEHVRNTPLPEMGDPDRRWTVELSEPEINAIHACMSFVRSACQVCKYNRYWEHYGPWIEGLSNRLFEQTEPEAAEAERKAARVGSGPATEDTPARSKQITNRGVQ